MHHDQAVGAWHGTRPHPFSGGLLHGVQELAQVEGLPVLGRVPARQHGGEVGDGGVQVARVAALLAQHVVQVLLDERPLPPAVHPQHLPAARGGRHRSAKADQGEALQRH